MLDMLEYNVTSMTSRAIYHNPLPVPMQKNQQVILKELAVDAARGQQGDAIQVAKSLEEAVFTLSGGNEKSREYSPPRFLPPVPVGLSNGFYIPVDVRQ